MRQGQHIFYYNIFEELDSPQEFYLNRTTGQLFFWPPTPITGDSDVIVSVTGGALFSINGTSDVVIKGKLYLRFEIILYYSFKFLPNLPLQASQ